MVHIIILWELMTPFGNPVDPDVKRIFAGASRSIDDLRSENAAPDSVE
jgi:hypothetical protein